MCAENKCGLDLNHVFQLVEEQVKIMSHRVFGAVFEKTARTRENLNDTFVRGDARGVTRRQPDSRISSFATDLHPSETRCSCCNSDHLVAQCERFQRATAEERWKIVKNKSCLLNTPEAAVEMASGVYAC